MTKWAQLSCMALLFGYLLGCAQGHCRRQNQESTMPVNKQDPSPKTKVNTRQLKVYKRRVLVYKYDESKQCQAWAGISLEEMEKELEPVKILSRKKKNDGLQRLQVCGSSTGIANVYEIYEDSLEHALKKGFHLWKFD